MINQFPVVILGGGPVGMAAAAHLIERKKKFVLIEKGKTVGHSLMQWQHVRLFSPWKYNIDHAAKKLLEMHGWTAPPEEILPTGQEIVQQYLLPLAELPELQPFILTDSRVRTVQRYGIDKTKTPGRETFPFEVLYEKDGSQHLLYASAVIDATGTWDTPNPLGAGGNPADGEQELASKINYGIADTSNRDRKRYAGKSVAVIGSGHSAVNSMLELDQLKQLVPETKILWIVRNRTVHATFGGGTNDALPARGALGLKIQQLVREKRIEVHAPFRIHSIQESDGKLLLTGLAGHEKKMIEGVDELIGNTGARPDFSFLRELRVAADASLESVPALAGMIDPNIHSCGTVRPHGEAELRQPEKNFYIVGSKSYGRAPTFLMATGYEQVRSITAALAGDWKSAKKTELHLPETGVCGVPSK